MFLYEDLNQELCWYFHQLIYCYFYTFFSEKCKIFSRIVSGRLREETEVEMDGSVSPIKVEVFTPNQQTEDVKMESLEVKGMIVRTLKNGVKSYYYLILNPIFAFFQRSVCTLTIKVRCLVFFLQNEYLQNLGYQQLKCISPSCLYSYGLWPFIRGGDVSPPTNIFEP